MPSPFPGMDPYLEAPAYWSGFHTRFTVSISTFITHCLPTGYFAEVEQIVWLEREEERNPFAIPDVFLGGPGSRAVLTAPLETLPSIEVTLPKLLRKKAPKHIQIVDQAGNRVITVIELLSPSNKSPGEDRESYLHKRNEYLASGTNLVELDLLREGQRLPMGKPRVPQGDYYALVSNSARYPKASVWSWSVRDPLPTLPIPLKPEHGEILIDLKVCLDRTYDDAGYATRINYASPPEYQLRRHDAEWAAELVKSKLIERK